QRATEPRLCSADTAPAMKVFERVDAEPDRQGGARLPGAGEDLVDTGSGAGRGSGGQHHAAEAAARGLGVEDLDMADAAALIEERLGLGGGAHRARDPSSEVNGDDVAPGGQ